MSAPDKATEIKAAVTAIIAFMTAVWGYLGWAILLMICAIVLDYITGTWAAKRRGEWSSDAARDGLWHKLGEIVALLVAALCDLAVRVLLHTSAAPLIGDFTWKDYITLVVTVWYLFTELGSILENLSKLGVPIPKWLVEGVAKMKEKTEPPNAIPGDEKT